MKYHKPKVIWSHDLKPWARMPTVPHGAVVKCDGKPIAIWTGEGFIKHG